MIKPMVRYKKHGLALGILLYQQLNSVIQMTALKKILNVTETSCFYCCVCILHLSYHYTIIWNNNNENFNPQILPILWLPLSTDNRINLSLFLFSQFLSVWLLRWVSVPVNWYFTLSEDVCYPFWPLDLGFHYTDKGRSWDRLQALWQPWNG